MNPITEWSDAFEQQIARGTRNTIEIPSVYDFNPERLRLFVDGTRQEPQDIPTKFTDGKFAFDLEPAAGETLSIESSERPRYIPGYDAEMSCAARVPSGLGTGDTARFGMRDRQNPENRVFYELNGGTNRVVLEKEGTEITSETFTYPENVDVTKPVRYQITYNAYSVGRFQFELSFTDETHGPNGRQRNIEVAKLAVDDEFASGEFNYHLFQEIDASNSGLQLRAGSFAYVVLGDIQETARTKAARLTGLSYGGSGEYEALAATRIDPSRGNIYCQLRSADVFPDGGAGELLVAVFKPSETDATGFATPPEHNPNNSVIEQTTNITTFDDNSGNAVTSTNNPGGYQIGFDVFEASGQGSSTRTSTSQQVENKRPLYEDDVAVFLYKADTANAREINLTYFVEQDW